jgi:purine-binding chemotaxis protein CheW
MPQTSYLTFKLQDILYGIEANLVKEIFFLPELNSIAEASSDLIGTLDLRGKTVPIMHLDLRWGNPMPECKISDRVIILECDGLTVGLIANDVKEVRAIESNIIEKTLDDERFNKIDLALVTGVTKEEKESIILLDSKALIRETDAIKYLTEEELDSHATAINFYRFCCPNATAAEKAMFRRQAENLRQVSLEENSKMAGQIPIAVIGLGGQHFAIALDTVREFINVRSYTPIPCCPKHIIGNVNLRGEIITLVDIRSALNLPVTTVKTGTKVAIVCVDDIVAGLPVDEVLDVAYLRPETINPISIAVSAGSQAYLKETVAYEEKKLSLIDLPALMARGELVVDEKV